MPRGILDFRFWIFDLHVIQNPKSKIQNPVFLTGKRGSFSLEYAVTVVVVVAAMVGMGVCFKRALAGKWRGIGDSFGYGRQYEPK